MCLHPTSARPPSADCWYTVLLPDRWSPVIEPHIILRRSPTVQRHDQYCKSRVMRLCSRVNETEDVVEDVVAASAIRQQLESLGIAHRSLLLIDLRAVLASVPALVLLVPAVLTRSLPETKTRIPPFSFDGWASRLATSCWTLEKGRLCRYVHSVHVFSRCKQVRSCPTYGQLLDDACGTLGRRILKREHRMIFL